MATLVLTAVGSLVGGPIGGAIGAILGQQVDQRVLGPKRRGPRLGDLSVQTSTYGAALPKLFGTMRVAGTVIWSTDLQEDSHRSGGGKGQGSTTTYSYSASFAVALSGRPVRSIGRIWADGKLLRGAGGDWKSAVGGFRLHDGGEDQVADPLIASAEGIAATPAHRGIAYVVFDSLQLADFGNRIPSLTFEVVADAATSVGAIAGELSDGALVGGETLALDGYAASGDSVRGAIEVLGAAFSLPLRDDGARLRIASEDLATLPEAELGSRSDDTREPRLARDRRAASALPDEIAIAYYEPARDYQAGLQRARRDGIALRGDRIDLPAAIGAAAAKGLAEEALARAWRQRDRATARLPWRRLETSAGTRVQIGAERWRATSWTLDRMVLELGLDRDGPTIGSISASSGRATTERDALPGATVLHLLDLPAFDGALASTPRLWLAAAGTGEGWRRAELSLSLDSGASWTMLGRTAPAAVMGVVAAPPAPGTAALFDRVATLEVECLHAGMALPAGGDAALVAGRNLALVGDELIVFGTATQTGPSRWRISDLLRGRYGTEDAIATHAAGERFVLIERERLLAVDLPVAAIGTVAAVSGLGPGDAVAVGATATMDGVALRPPRPVGVRLSRAADGAIRIDWCRRSRVGWAWLDGADVPLGEASELYRVTLASGAMSRTVETGVPSFAYSTDEQLADGVAPGAALTLSIAQVGTYGPSPAASLSLTI